jgi:hypothetical protein
VEVKSDDADLDYWLSRWANWMRWNLDELPHGNRPIACGFENARTNFMVAEDDSETYWECHTVPSIVRAIDAAIDSLGEHEKRCLWWRYGLTKIEPTAVAITFPEAFERVRVLVLKRVAIA